MFFFFENVLVLDQVGIVFTPFFYSGKIPWHRSFCFWFSHVSNIHLRRQVRQRFLPSRHLSPRNSCSRLFYVVFAWARSITA